MEFCPHCGLHLGGRRDFCPSCGPRVCWWFADREIVNRLGLAEEESWREANGNAHPRGWERKEDGRFHPFSWVRSEIDERYYPHDWVREINGVYTPRDFFLKTKAR